MKSKISIIFGLGPAGLFLSRQLKKAGISVIGICKNDDIGQYSNSIKECFIADDNEKLTCIVNKICNEYSKINAYVCSDRYITMLVESNIKLELLFCKNEIKNLKLINNKDEIYSICEQLGFNIPREKILSSVVGKTKIIKYPIILKFNTKQINNKNNPIGKTKVVFKQHDLDKIIEEIGYSDIDTTDIVVQRYLKGNNNNQFSFGGYFNKGKCVVGIVVNQLQQYPQGVSALVVESNNVDANKYIRKKVQEFAAKINYSGFLEMEFKYFKQNNKWYMLDINPRPWGWVSILGIKYPDFFKIFQGNREIERNSKRVMWKSKYRCFRGRVNKKNVKFKGANEYLVASDIYDTKDRKPSIMILKIGIKKIIERNLN